MKRSARVAKALPPQHEATSQLMRLFTSTGHKALQMMNAAGRSLLNDGRALVRIETGLLLRKSRSLTGLEDFGDTSFLVALDRLIHSFNEDADLNLLGRLTVRREMLRLLCNRLCMQRDRSLFPAIARERIRQPIFITGLPRSGTTFLHGLLAQDPGCRAPLVWEVMHPSPPPESGSHRSDPRISLTRRELSWVEVLMPDFGKCHRIEACLPQECIAMTDHSFLSYLFETMYYVTSYRSWHDGQDKRPAYLYHRQFLQQLQWRCPGSHWVLKAPSHMMALRSLLEVYPDAQIVMTHRDPLKVLPSCASFTEVLRSPFTGPIQREVLGAEVSRRWVDAARDATRLRAAQRGVRGRFFDVSYPELIRDPMAVVQGIYREFDRDLTGDAVEAMRRYLAREPKDKGGAHSYSLEKYGLDGETEREKFREYLGYFAVEPE